MEYRFILNHLTNNENIEDVLLIVRFNERRELLKQIQVLPDLIELYHYGMIEFGHLITKKEAQDKYSLGYIFERKQLKKRFKRTKVILFVMESMQRRL